MESNPTIKRREQENSVRALRREYFTVKDAGIIYDMERHKLVEIANEAGAIYKVSANYILIKKSLMDEYFEQFHVKAGRYREDKESDGES